MIAKPQFVGALVRCLLVVSVALLLPPLCGAQVPPKPAALADTANGFVDSEFHSASYLIDAGGATLVTTTSSLASTGSNPFPELTVGFGPETNINWPNLYRPFFSAQSTKHEHDFP